MTVSESVLSGHTAARNGVSQVNQTTYAVYRFHGVDLEDCGENQLRGSCPFCDNGDGKLYVVADTGAWYCQKCKMKGSIIEFLRELWNLSDKVSEKDLLALCKDRSLLSIDTLKCWGIRRSITTDEWIVPGYNIGGKIIQLYRYAKVPKSNRMALLATPKHGHGLLGVNLFDKGKKNILLCEGLWDAMAGWESMRYVGRLNATDHCLADEKHSLLNSFNVLATPSCGTFQAAWLPMFSGSHIVFGFDNDHIRQNEKTNTTYQPAMDGMKRAVEILTDPTNGKIEQPERISYIKWGNEGDGYSKEIADGFDLRDYLSTTDDVLARGKKIDLLLTEHTALVPNSWRLSGIVSGRSAAEPSDTSILWPLPCESWFDLELAWKDALLWRDGLSDVLSAMLAVTTSTLQIGNQLFLQVIGDAGSGKTELCEGLLVSRHCHSLEHLTGFHSGFKGDAGEDADFSLISRINKKTLITPEGDVLMSNPRFQEIMSQQRRIFDGSSSATYKNSRKDQRYTGLRTPWIIAGTRVLLDMDQSRLGDRFLRIFMDVPPDEHRRHILERVCQTARRCVVKTSNGRADMQLDKKLALARQLTGGYVNHLRENIEDIISPIERDTPREICDDVCMDLAEYAAIFRARPAQGKKAIGNSKDAKELPSRLVHQFIRFAFCLAAATNKKEVDESVIRRVCKIADNTANGETLEVAKVIHQAGQSGITTEGLSVCLAVKKNRIDRLIDFMSNIGIVKSKKRIINDQEVGLDRWHLSPFVSGLMTRIDKQVHTK